MEPDTKNVLILNPLEDSRWDAFVASQSDATPFHSTGWLQALAESFRFRVTALCCAGPDGRITCGIPFIEKTGLNGKKKRICLPFTDRCGPIGDSADFAEFVLPHLLQGERNGAARTEIRDTLPDGGDVRDETLYWGHRIALPSRAEDCRLRFSDCCKRNLRKAEKTGLRAVIGTDRDLLKAFYRLHVLTRRKLGVPVQPKSFIDAIHRRMVKPGKGWLVVVFAKDVPIAAGLFLMEFGQVVWKYGASNPSYLRICPNNFLLWKAIEHSCSLGMQVFDFGRTELSQVGLRSFKLGWGSQEFEYRSYTWPRTEKPKVFRRALQRLASPVIRNSPVMVSRVLGEAFYGYFP